MVTYTVEFYGPKGPEIAGNRGDHNHDKNDAIALVAELIAEGYDIRLSTHGNSPALQELNKQTVWTDLLEDR